MSRESRRLELHETLVSILGSSNVYFQPPANFIIQYPCIIYSYENETDLHANGSVYLTRDKYSITLITKQALPEELMNGISAIPYTRFDRHYTVDNLHHFTYTTETFERY